MHQSTIGSWQTVNNGKGNHCRKVVLANNYLGVIGKTYNTPSSRWRGAINMINSRVNSTTFIFK